MARAIRRRMHRELEKQQRDRARRTRVAAGAAAAIGSTVLFADGAAAAEFEVTNTDDSGAGSLRDAVAQAEAAGTDDVITFAPGIGSQITLTTGEIQITNDNGGLEIQGPGPGQLTVSGNDSSRIFDADDDNSPAVPLIISGLTLSDGAADRGGALRVQSFAFELRDVVLTGNDATQDGGALLTDSGFGANGGTVAVEDTRITGNTADDGGGWYVEDARNPSGYGDLAISSTDLVVDDNEATKHGGGIYLYDPDGSILFERTTVSGNTAADRGGGIYLYSFDAGGLTISESTVSGNEAGTGGGVYLYNPDADGSVIENTTIAGNTATGDGGGLRVDQLNEVLSIESSTIADNTGTGGAGVDIDGDDPRIDDSVIADNTGGTDLDTDATGGYSLIGTQTGTFTEDPVGSNIFGADPDLGTLADNGGPTETILPQPSSPLLENANSPLPEDQRGFSRPVDLNEVADGPGNQSDIGAVEIRAIANSAPPAISGQAEVGSTLTSSTGQWTSDYGVSDYTYQWLRCSGAGCGAIPGATSSTYEATDADIGFTIRVDVTADDGVSTASERSAATAAVSRPETPITADCNGTPATIVAVPGEETIGTSGPDVIVGTSGDDEIKGLGGDDQICAGDGDDLVLAGAGDDEVAAGTGDDQVAGDEGDDALYGEGGADTLIGEAGDDYIFGANGDDKLRGRDGDDELLGRNGEDDLRGNQGSDEVSGGADDDAVRGDADDDLIKGNGGSDELRGASGNDEIRGAGKADDLFGGKGDDLLNGGKGRNDCNGGSGDNELINCD